MTEFFRNTLSGWQWALLALVPPAIIALYFLKLRRQPLEVPSTYLWKRSIEDMHVNSLWQRLRRNLLMFLQLLLVALAILALLRPGWEGTRLDGQRFIFVIDNSASMAATDVADAANRLAEAKASAIGLVDQMDSSMTAMVISFAETPQVVQEFTSNRRLLRERINAIQPTARGTDLRGAMELASSLANPGRVVEDVAAETEGHDDTKTEARPATTYIFSDGRFEDVAGVTLENLQPVYVPVGSFEAKNLAITALSTRRSEERRDERQAFVQVSNFTAAPQKVVVELSLEGQFLDAAEIEVPAGEAAGTVLPLPAGAIGGLTAKLKYELEGKPTDALAQDDVAYAAINDTGTGRVLVVTPGNLPLEVALGTERAKRLANVEFVSPATLESADYRREAAAGAYDLVIYDQCAPQELPRANVVFVGKLPPGAAWRGGERSEDTNGETADEQDAADVPVAGPQILDWDRVSPLVAHLELGDVDLAESLVLQPPAGGDVLIESTIGPIAAIAPRDSYQDAVLGFEIVGLDADGVRTANTNWPLRPSFPTFWLNVLEYLATGSEEQEAAAVRPGRPIELRSSANVDRLTVVAPGGREYPVTRSAQDSFQFAATDVPGVYVVRQGAAATERFAVNLFDRAESDVGVRPSQDPESQTLRPADIRIGDADIAAATDRTPARHELWKVLLAGALFVLVLEWYIYNRRVYL